MKKFIFISLFAFAAFAVNAQQAFQSLPNDTTKGLHTVYCTATASCPYSGIAIFDFTVVNRTQDTMLVILQGSDDGFVTYINLDTVKHKVTTTATNYQLTDFPATFLNYRLQKIGSANDTSRFSKQRFIYKR